MASWWRCWLDVEWNGSIKRLAKDCLDNLIDVGSQLRGVGGGIKEVQAAIRLKREL